MSVVEDNLEDPAKDVLDLIDTQGILSKELVSMSNHLKLIDITGETRAPNAGVPMHSPWNVAEIKGRIV